MTERMNSSLLARTLTYSNNIWSIYERLRSRLASSASIKPPRPRFARHFTKLFFKVGQGQEKISTNPAAKITPTLSEATILDRWRGKQSCAELLE